MSGVVQVSNNLTETKIEYFIDYWRDLTHENQSIESDLIHSILYNPKELIKEFIEEKESNYPMVITKSFLSIK